MKSASIVALLIISSVAAVAQNRTNDAPTNTSCPELNHAAIRQAANGHLAEAEALVPAATDSGDQRSQNACRGQVLSNLAGMMSVSGHIAEAERLAEQSVRILERSNSPNDRALLRPLQILAFARLESGETARAREAFKRMQTIRIERPEDGALVHGISAAFLQEEGRQAEAEAEYLATIRAWGEAGRGETADAGDVLYALASLYIEEQRLEEARQTLDRALAIFSHAKDAVPTDRITLLDLRGVLDARLGLWQRSEQDLRDALLIADRQPSVDPALLRSLLGNYSSVLRRNHHRREARPIEAHSRSSRKPYVRCRRGHGGFAR